MYLSELWGRKPDLGCFNSVREDRQHYDLMNIVMLCLGENQKSERNAPGMLKTLFSTEDNIKDKTEILDKTFDLKMMHELETEVSEMCNLSEGVYAKGLDVSAQRN